MALPDVLSNSTHLGEEKDVAMYKYPARPLLSTDSIHDSA